MLHWDGNDSPLQPVPAAVPQHAPMRTPARRPRSPSPDGQSATLPRMSKRRKGRRVIQISHRGSAGRG